MDGSLIVEFEERLRKANQAMGMLKTVWKIITFQYTLKQEFIKLWLELFLFMGMNRGIVQ